jgi:hypothetical protein
MDSGTIAAYDRSAKRFAPDWDEQSGSDDTRRLLAQYFAPSGRTDEDPITGIAGCCAPPQTATAPLRRQARREIHAA